MIFSAGVRTTSLDLGLPDLTGYELLLQLRARLGSRAPYMTALTGWAEARTKAFAVAFDQCLVKPAAHAQLYAVLELAESERRRGS